MGGPVHATHRIPRCPGKSDCPWARRVNSPMPILQTLDAGAPRDRSRGALLLFTTRHQPFFAKPLCRRRPTAFLARLSNRLKCLDRAGRQPLTCTGAWSGPCAAGLPAFVTKDLFTNYAPAVAASGGPSRRGGVPDRQRAGRHARRRPKPGVAVWRRPELLLPSQGPLLPGRRRR